MGEVIPLSKKALTADMKRERPFRGVYGGLDFSMSFYKGPPFKYLHSLKEHTNFVNCVRYSPDGSLFASVGSDKGIHVYTGAEGEHRAAITATPHKGSVYALAWAPDGGASKFVTASADKHLKVWDVEAGTCLQDMTLGTTVDDMQPGVAWPKLDTVVSLSLDGKLNFVNPDAGEVVRTATGHVAAANAVAVDAGTGRIVTGDIAGRVCVWSASEAGERAFTAQVVSGTGHRGKVVGVAAGGGAFASIGFDDFLRFGGIEAAAFEGEVKLAGQPRDLCVSSANAALRAVVTRAGLWVYEDAREVATLSTSYEPTCVHMVPVDGGKHAVAVGGADNKIHFYVLDGSSITEDGVCGKAFNGALSRVALSPGAKYCAGGDALREIKLFDGTPGSAHDTLKSGKWMTHTTRITGLEWSPEGDVLVSVSSDRRITWWNPEADSPIASHGLAHAHPFADVAWSHADAAGAWAIGTDGVAKWFPAP